MNPPHSGVSECNYNWDDILKGLYFIQFLIFAGGLTLFYYAWPIGLALFVCVFRFYILCV